MAKHWLHNWSAEGGRSDAGIRRKEIRHQDGSGYVQFSSSPFDISTLYVFSYVAVGIDN
jgi:hypothetical protein